MVRAGPPRSGFIAFPLGGRQTDAMVGESSADVKFRVQSRIKAPSKSMTSR